MFVKSIFVTLGLTALALAAPGGAGGKGDKGGCGGNGQLVCKDKNTGLAIIPDLLNIGGDCSQGDVFCCSNNDVASGILNIDLNVQCVLSDVL